MAKNNKDNIDDYDFLGEIDKYIGSGGDTVWDKLDTRAKRKARAAGKQHAAQPKNIKKKTKRFRKVS